VGCLLANRIKRSRGFFSAVGGIGAGDPMFGALPAHPEPLEGRAHRLATDVAAGNALCDANLRRQREGPEAGRLAKGPRALVQQAAEALPPPLVQDGLGWVRTRRLGLESRCTPVVEGVESMADGLIVATQSVSDDGGVRALGTGQQDLAAADGKGLGRVEAGF
jgi:hypothetical protein